MPKIRVSGGVGYIGCDHEMEFDIDDEEWEGMSQEERDAKINQFAWDEMTQQIDIGMWEIVEE